MLYYLCDLISTYSFNCKCTYLLMICNWFCVFCVYVWTAQSTYSFNGKCTCLFIICKWFGFFPMYLSFVFRLFCTKRETIRKIVYCFRSVNFPIRKSEHYAYCEGVFLCEFQAYVFPVCNWFQMYFQFFSA